MVKISVIIPCYNLGHYLDETVDSVLAQTYRDFEIVIVNDGSTDAATNRLLSHYEKPYTTVFTTDNQGLAAARNFGITRSSGEYVCCLDADDTLHPQYLEKTVAILEADTLRENGFVTTLARVFGESNHIWETSGYDPVGLLRCNCVHVASLFRRQCWREIGGYAGNLQGYQDWNFWIAIAARGYRWHLVAEPLFNYRVRPGSMLSNSNRNRSELYRTIIENNLGYYRENIVDLLVGGDAKQNEMQAYITRLENECVEIHRHHAETRGSVFRRIWKRLHGTL